MSKFQCIKSVIMQKPGKRGRVFTKGKPYISIEYDEEDGYCVIDDSENEHWIAEPGHKWFDNHFLIS